MAKLGSYYGLCPLIDQRSLLGVTDDWELGHVIVTLGKNIAVKYRLSDQKQIHSWRTKDKFSSPVIYDDELNHYVSVFNHVYVRMWKGEEEYVDKLKKYKFNTPIHSLVKCNKKSFVIFKNGDVAPLNYAIDHRKDTVMDATNRENDDLDVVTAFLEDNLFVGAIIKKETNSFVWTVLCGDNKEAHKVELTRENAELVGYTLSQTENQLGVHLLTLWSDGKFYSYPIYNQTKVESPGNLFAFIESISCKSPVKMVVLNCHYIAIYGADPNQEGALLILYNSQFKVSQSKQSFKLFSSGSRLWHVENNILLSVGQNLAVIPFHLDVERLAALVGSHRSILGDPDVALIEEMEVTDWNDERGEDVSTNAYNAIPKKIKTKVSEYLKQGLSEASMFQEMLPQLIEKNDVEYMSCCLDYFCDIPESCLAKLLRFCLNVDSKFFKTSQMITSTLIPVNLQPLGRCKLLEKILVCPFSDILLLPHVQSEIDLTSSIELLQYICYLMMEESHLLPSSNILESENKLIKWGCLLLDANYQKFLLSSDNKILVVLCNYSKLVNQYLSSLNSMRQLEPLLIQIKKGKEVFKHKEMADSSYSIEQLSLY